MTVYNFFILIWYSWQYLISLEKTILGCCRELHEANVDLELGLGDDLEGDLDLNLEPLGEITTDGDLDRLEETESKKNQILNVVIMQIFRSQSCERTEYRVSERMSISGTNTPIWYPVQTKVEKQKVMNNPVFGTWLHPIPWVIIEVTSITSTNGLVVPYDRDYFDLVK